MTLPTPDWLTQHNGQLRPTFNGCGTVVVFDDEPQYVVTPVPAQGKYGVRIMQTINGRQLPVPAIYPTAEEALRGGLEELRKVLGW